MLFDEMQQQMMAAQQQEPQGLFGGMFPKPQGGWFAPNPNIPAQAMMGFGMGMLSGEDRASGW